MNAQITIVGILALAYWPVWSWYFARTLDGSDEPWGLCSLLAAVVYAFVAIKKSPAVTAAFAIFGPAQALLMVAYCLLLPIAPMQIQAIIAVTSIGLACSRLFLRRVEPGFLALLLLSLPVVSSMQFYLGYPLRLVVAKLSAISLHFMGFAVGAKGTGLSYLGQTFEVDAPCSGIRMLWSGLFLAALLICMRRVNLRGAVVLFPFAVIAVIGTNVIRATSLFYVNAMSFGPYLDRVIPDWHGAIGLSAFLASACAIYFVAGKLPALSSEQARCLRPQCLASSALQQQSRLRHSCTLLAIATALVPIIVHLTAPPAVVAGFPGWPSHFESNRLVPLPLTEVERQFQKGFPGKIGRFSDGHRQVVLRWIGKETRQLHPSSDCFRGSGYAITALPLVVDACGRRWESFRAESLTNSLIVREIICDHNGHSWTDTSQWYWSALLGKTTGPWWAYTVAERS
jgi:exosortase/archaeosortase family protein